MDADVGILSDVGLRLRVERDRLRLNQEDFGRLGGVTRNSQQNYEAGKRPFDANYLLSLIPRGIDVQFVLTGQRPSGLLNEEASQLVNAFGLLTLANRRAVLQIACSLADQPVPYSSTGIPSTPALAASFEELLAASPGLAGAELAHELAKRLPTILRAAEGEIASDRTGSNDDAPAPRSAHDDAPREARQGRRT